MKKLGVIIPAGGNGTRMGVTATPKQFLLLGGSTAETPRQPVLAHVIAAFRRVAPEAEIVVALPADRTGEWAQLCREYNIPPHKVCEGGPTRFHSVRNALAKLSDEVEYVAVHDAARPLVSAGLILRTVETAHAHGSAIPVVPLVDTVRRIVEIVEPEPEIGAGTAGESTATSTDGETNPYFGAISHPEERDMLRAVQTPQVFRADILRKSYEQAAQAPAIPAGNAAVALRFTDDAGVVEAAGYTVMLCEGERRNIKLTEPADIAIAESILKNENN